MKHLPKGDTLTKGRYTYQREIHLPKGDTLTKGRYTYQREIHLPNKIHFSNNDTLFE